MIDQKTLTDSVEKNLKDYNRLSNLLSDEIQKLDVEKRGEMNDLYAELSENLVNRDSQKQMQTIKKIQNLISTL